MEVSVLEFIFKFLSSDKFDYYEFKMHPLNSFIQIYSKVVFGLMNLIERVIYWNIDFK